MRIVYILPEPTPYRSPLLDRIASEPGIELFVIYAGSSVQGRTWSVVTQHPHVVLRGARLPLLRHVLLHDYPVDLGAWRALSRQRPDVVVVAGWSTFPSQLGVLWSRRHRIPYVVALESHDDEPRRSWTRGMRAFALPRLFRGAAGVLATGTRAAEYARRYGADAAEIRIFPNTIDVDAFAARVDALRVRRHKLRRSLGIGADEVIVLSAARLVHEKGLDVLAEAIAAVPSTRLLIAGDGPERPRLLGRRGVRLLGALDAGDLLELYAAADVFALLSRREPWGVVVNEAAAAGLPLLLSDRVGAGHDLLHPGENGELVAPDDVAAASAALERLASDAVLRQRYGASSREIVSAWGYGSAVANFVAAVRAATA